MKRLQGNCYKRAPHAHMHTSTHSHNTHARIHAHIRMGREREREGGGKLKITSEEAVSANNEKILTFELLSQAKLFSTCI